MTLELSRLQGSERGTASEGIWRLWFLLHVADQVQSEAI